MLVPAPRNFPRVIIAHTGQKRQSLGARDRTLQLSVTPRSGGSASQASLCWQMSLQEWGQAAGGGGETDKVA